MEEAFCHHATSPWLRVRGAGRAWRRFQVSAPVHEAEQLLQFVPWGTNRSHCSGISGGRRYSTRKLLMLRLPARTAGRSSFSLMCVVSLSPRTFLSLGICTRFGGLLFYGEREKQRETKKRTIRRRQQRRRSACCGSPTSASLPASGLRRFAR